MTDDHRTAPPPPLCFGPYQVCGELGRGGMGVVYEAVHVETGEVVAIKTAQVRDASISRLDAIRREIRALGRLNHPGVVRIVDAGETNGLPWVAMCRLRGRTLYDHIRELWANPSAPPPLGPTLTLIRRLCAPLAYIHGEGLVHRDLKPDNVFLQKGDQPVLVDLGLVVHFGGEVGREELDVEQPAGTRPYMAPEQSMGTLVDARADLYALGCILYECVTGRRFFNAGVRRASAIVPGLPRELDELISRLLEPKPKDRPGYAVDVAAALVSMSAEAETDEGERPRMYLYRSELRGRKKDQAALEDAVSRLIHERRGGLVLVHGESGVGKTRLIREVGPMAWKAAGEQRPMVLSGACVARGAGDKGATFAVDAPLRPLRPLLLAAADRARISKDESTRLFGPRGRILGAYEPTLLDLPGQDEQPEPSPRAPGKARERVIQAMLEVVWALGEREPLLFMLDDLQWADELTLAVLEAFAKSEPEGRGVLFVATCRSDEAERLVGTPGVERMRLDRLDPWSIDEIVAGMLAQPTPPRAVLDALARHANGNPFFVTQYLHAALEEGILRRDEAGDFCFDVLGAGEAIAALPLPDTVESLIARRLNRLDPKGRALTSWAAVLGQEFDEELLRAGVQGAAATTEVLDAILARGILEVTWKGSLRFVHEKLRESAYQRIDPQDRAALHRRAGEALEARIGRAKDKAATLGHHFDRAGLYAKAARYFTQAATHARKSHASVDAIRFYEAAIEALRRAQGAKNKRAELARLHERKGDVLALGGHHAEARSAYAAALEQHPAAPHVDRARRLRKSGETWKLGEQFSQGLALYEQAEAALEGGPRTKAWWNEWLRIQMERLFVYYKQADTQKIAALYIAIEPDVIAWGSAGVRARYFDRRAMYNLRCDRYQVSRETLRYMRKSVAAARKGRDVYDRLGAGFDLGMVLWLGGKLQKAELQMLEVLDGAKRAGYQEFETRSATYLTVIMRRQRQAEPTEWRAQESLCLAKQAQARDYVGVALANLAWVALRRRDHAEAERLGGEALAEWGQISQLVFPFQWLIRLPLCAVRFSRGDLDGAMEQARAVLTPDQQRLPLLIEVALAKAVDAFAEGQKAEAESNLREALRSARKLGYA